MKRFLLFLRVMLTTMLLCAQEQVLFNSAAKADVDGYDYVSNFEIDSKSGYFNKSQLTILEPNEKGLRFIATKVPKDVSTSYDILTAYPSFLNGSVEGAGVTSNSNGNFSGGLPGFTPGFTGFAASNFGQGWGGGSGGSSTNNTKTESVMTVDEVYGKGNQSIVESQGDYEVSSNEKSNVEKRVKADIAERNRIREVEKTLMASEEEAK